MLRYSEIIKDENGVEIKKFQTEWLCGKPVSKGNWYSFMFRGRMRGLHEDMHNTLKNRGFAAKHDYARTDPNLWLIWKVLMFVAFFIFELFSFTNIAKDARGQRSWMKFAADLLQQLVELVWCQIEASSILLKHKVQFRYDFPPY